MKQAAAKQAAVKQAAAKTSVPKRAPAKTSVAKQAAAKRAPTKQDSTFAWLSPASLAKAEALDQMLHYARDPERSLPARVLWLSAVEHWDHDGYADGAVSLLLDLFRARGVYEKVVGYALDMAAIPHSGYFTSDGCPNAPKLLELLPVVRGSQFWPHTPMAAFVLIAAAVTYGDQNDVDSDDAMDIYHGMGWADIVCNHLVRMAAFVDQAAAFGITFPRQY